jgi:hypothetical protein
MKIKPLSLLLGFFWLAAFSMAQTTGQQYKVDSSSLSLFPVPNFYANVRFTDPLDSSAASDLATDNITITSTPTHSFSIGNVQRQPGTKKGIQIALTGDPPADVTSAQICFHKLNFLDSQNKAHSVSEVCGNPEIETSASVAGQRDKVLAELKTVPKTSSEKNIFASGFTTTSSSGTDGGVNLNLNSNDLGVPGFTVFLHLDKATSPGGDPKNFEAGPNFRNIVLFGRADLQQMQKDIAELRTNPTPQRRAQLLDELNSLESKKRFWSALLIDFSGELEGEALNFNVTNFVGNGQLSLQSRTQRLFGSNAGFWRFRLVPAGIEGGKNLNSTTTQGVTTTTPSSSSEDYVARVKAGGQLTLFYENRETPFPLKRVNLDLGMVQRYLFFKEAQVSSTPGVATTFNQRRKPWYQASLKIYLVDTPKGRYGLQLSYNNGSLPPTFSNTKSFQFGFLFETSDGEDAKPATK